MRDTSDWSETATADNALATATHAAEAGKTHYITAISASFSAAVAGKLLQLKDGATVVGNYHVHNQRDIVLTKPLRATAGNAVSVELAASAAGGTIGAVTLQGYTRER